MVLYYQFPFCHNDEKTAILMNTIHQANSPRGMYCGQYCESCTIECGSIDDLLCYVKTL